jgi:hypothetical protein
MVEDMIAIWTSSKIKTSPSLSLGESQNKPQTEEITADSKLLLSYKMDLPSHLRTITTKQNRQNMWQCSFEDWTSGDGNRNQIVLKHVFTIANCLQSVQVRAKWENLWNLVGNQEAVRTADHRERPNAGKNLSHVWYLPPEHSAE